MNINLVKKAIATYTYNILNTKYPTIFKGYTTTNASGTSINYRNVYWSETLEYRPIDATECCLDVTKIESINTKGIDSDFYYDEELEKYQTKTKEDIIVTVNFNVTSMKNKGLNLTDLQAQNLVNDTCMYIRNQLKSGSAFNYFQYDNDIFTPIEVLIQQGDLSDIEDVSYFEDTKYRFTSQFSCKFRYSEVGSYDTLLAQGAHIEIGEDELAENVEIDISLGD